MTSDLAKLMETINRLQSVETPEPVTEVENKVHPLLQAMQELREEEEQELTEAKISIRDQIINDIKQDGGNIDDYYVRTSHVDKLGYSTKQVYGRSPDLDDPDYSLDYIGYGKGKPALWFFPASFYIRDIASTAYAGKGNPHIWLVKLKPNAWLQTVDRDGIPKQEAPDGKERVGILKLTMPPAAIFFKPAFDVVKKYYDYGSQHQRHGEVKGPPIVEPEKKSFWQKIFKEEDILEAKESIKDQLEKAYLQDGDSIDQYFVRSSKVDKLGFSPKQIFARSPDLDHPAYDIDYIGNSVGNPALWFYPLKYYLQASEVFTKGYPYIWLVKLKPNAWLQPVDRFTKTKQDAPKGKERVGILKNKLTPAAIFFKPAFDVVDKFYDYGGQHKRHGLVKGAPVEEEIAYHGTVDDIIEFHPFTHFGTEKAAKDRMEYKKIKDGKIYKVDLDIKNPLQIKDFPGIHYDRQYAFELRDKGLISQDEMEAITFIEDKNELRKALLNKLKELDIDGFVYKNKYEDKGNISYVIVDPSQVKVLSVEPASEEVTEASPDTLEGSFTPDLVESKTWLAKLLAKGLKGKNAGTIYVLGSWYGNMGIFLQQAGVQFDKLVLVEPDEEALMRSKELLDTLNDDGKLILIHQKAEDIVYEKPCVVINTSCNETGPVFLTKLPDNVLCCLQARNNNEDSLFPTEQMEDFVDYFPLAKTYYTGEKQLEDPEINYTRFMMIGRSGKKLDETVSTGLGGGSAGSSGGQMVGGPTTYEQEYDMFKSKGPRRITAMTNEALDSSYPYTTGDPGNYFFTSDNGIEYMVSMPNKRHPDISFGAKNNQGDVKTGITGTGDSRKIFGTIVQIVKDFVAANNPETISFSADNSEESRIRLYKALANQVDRVLPDYELQDVNKSTFYTDFVLARKEFIGTGPEKLRTLGRNVRQAGVRALDYLFDESESDESS